MCRPTNAWWRCILGDSPQSISDEWRESRPSALPRPGVGSPISRAAKPSWTDVIRNARTERRQPVYGGSHILRNVCARCEVGEITVVLGRNGVGKTTLLKSIMGVVPIKSGSITLDGQPIQKETSYERVRAASASCRRAAKSSAA